MIKKFFILLSASAVLFSCQTSKNVVNRNLPEISISPQSEIYRASNTVLTDIQHMILNVSFDWEKKYLFGKQWLVCRPHFYPQDKLILDARGMQINAVALTDANQNALKKLTYDYRNDSLIINLDKEYTRTGTYMVYIDYIAKPEELKSIGGSAAINSDKGLYFINADGKEFGVPVQLWTQGETQSNSVWFPIIDSPNQRMTQEINITVDRPFETLSNGKLVKYVFNDDGRTRTDTWKQTLPAAPYLTMMAISQFKIVKDKWRNLEVNYYTDAEFETYAKNIFGNTPEMLEFFSQKLGVDYPWEKFSQVVVHDYVSGAMENTSAVLHGEFMQRNPRQLIDETYEDVISHELFHQWFGDLVTCESWSNIPLNESFATYGEYLWNEYKYGHELADIGLNNDLNGYINEAKHKQVNLIRFNYEEREDMFDSHSYAKGGRILHMLRKYVGDDAFFAALKKYLTDNKFKSVEAHNLRLAFEEVTGEDLNWFFNQWFFAAGHPDIEISYKWIDSLKKEIVTIEQKQNFETTPLYKIPLNIDIYENGKTRTEKIIAENKKEILFFDCTSKPALVNVDAEKQLLCTKTDNHTNEEWVYMYHHAPLFKDRHEALQALRKTAESDNTAAEVIIEALSDKNHLIRNEALNTFNKISKENQQKNKQKIIEMASADKNSSVRTTAIKCAVSNFSGNDITELLQKAVNDSSYRVMSMALEKLAVINPGAALAAAKKSETDLCEDAIIAITPIYAEHGNDENLDYMQRAYHYVHGFDKLQFAEDYGRFLQRCSPATIEKGKDPLIDCATNNSRWYVRVQATVALNELSRFIAEKKSKLSQQTEFDLISQYTKAKAYIDNAIAEIKKNEKDAKAIKAYEKM